MTSQLLIEDGVVGARAALVSDGKIDAVTLPFRPVDPALNSVMAAWVREKISGTRDCLLKLQNKQMAHLSARRGAGAKHVVEGKQLRVQIVRTADEDKLPEASTKLRVRGRYGTLFSSFRGVQNADGSPCTRPIMVPSGWGLTLNAAANDVSDAVIAAECARLEDARLLELEAMIAGLPARFDGQIVFGSHRLWAQRSTHLKARYPDLADVFTLQAGQPGALFDAAGVTAWLEAVADGVMPLPGGGAIRFGTVHGITVLDVNAGRAIRGGEARRINIEAARVIAHLLAAAQIGGLCIIDFIDMDGAADNHALHDALDAALKNDRDYSGRSDLSRFGCIEMRRRKTGPSLHHKLRSEPLLDAMVALDAAIIAAPPAVHGTLTLHAAPRLFRWLENRQVAKVLELQLMRPIVLTSDETLAPGGHHVALGSPAR